MLPSLPAQKASIDMRAVLPILLAVSLGSLAASVLYLRIALRALPLFRRVAHELYPLTQAAAVAVMGWAALRYDTGWIMGIIAAGCGVVCAAYTVVLFGGLMEAEAVDAATAYAQALDEQSRAQWAHLARQRAAVAESVRFQRSLQGWYAQVEEALANGHIEMVADMLDEQEARIPVRGSSFCRNRAVDALLAAKADQCAERAIEFCAEVALEHEEGVLDSELCAVFSNLIDNAMNACAALAVGRRWLRVSARWMGGALAIVVRNPVGEVEPDAEACALRGARKPARGSQGSGGALPLEAQLSDEIPEHGWGLTIVRAITERYRGSFTAMEETGEFCARVVLWPRVDGLRGRD